MESHTTGFMRKLAHAFFMYFLRLTFNLRVHEDVVDVQLEAGNIRDRHGVDSGLVEAGVVRVTLLEDVGGRSEIDIDESLSIRFILSLSTLELAELFLSRAPSRVGRTISCILIDRVGLRERANV